MATPAAALDANTIYARRMLGTTFYGGTGSKDRMKADARERFGEDAPVQCMIQVSTLWKGGGGW